MQGESNLVGDSRFGIHLESFGSSRIEEGRSTHIWVTL